MKVSKQTLKQIIKEELNKALNETDVPEGAEMAQWKRKTAQRELKQACQKCRQGRIKAKYSSTKCRGEQDKRCPMAAKRLGLALGDDMAICGSNGRCMTMRDPR